VLLLEDT